MREEQLFLGGAGHCLEVFRKEMVQTNQAAPENLAAVLLAKPFFPAIQDFDELKRDASLGNRTKMKVLA